MELRRGRTEVSARGPGRTRWVITKPGPLENWELWELPESGIKLEFVKTHRMRIVGTPRGDRRVRLGDIYTTFRKAMAALTPRVIEQIQWQEHPVRADDFAVMVYPASVSAAGGHTVFEED